MVEIGKKIKQHRLQLDLTQEELAQRTELTKGYISQLENDLCSPSIATLEDILHVLGVSLQEFFSEPKHEQVVFTPQDFFLSKNGDGTNTWLIPNSQVKQMEPIILTLPQGGQCEERLPFEGEEVGYSGLPAYPAGTGAGPFLPSLPRWRSRRRPLPYRPLPCRRLPYRPRR